MRVYELSSENFRLLVPTDGGINEIPLNPMMFQPPEYVTGLLTFRKQFYYDVAVLFHGALSKNKVVACSVDECFNHFENEWMNEWINEQ